MAMVFSRIMLTVAASWLIHPSPQSRVVADCTIAYAIQGDMGAGESAETLSSSTKTIYIRGNDSRVDLVSPSFTQSLIYNKSKGIAVILRDFGNNHFMTRMTPDKWQEQNRKYEGMIVSLKDDTRRILGYDCKKAEIKLKDGSVYSLYYTVAIAPSVRDFEYQFKDIPGFVLEYELQDAKGQKISYVATKVDLNPVPTSRFDIPTKDYRVLN
jgi:GLPGLI family protein